MNLRTWGREKSSVQFTSVAQSCLTLYNPMDCSTPGLPVHHQLPEFTQTHVHWVGGAIQPSHPLSSPSPSIFSSIRVFTNESVLGIRWPKYWSFSFSINLSNDFLWDWLVWSPCCSRDPQESSPTPQFKSIKIPHSTEQLGPCTTTTEAQTPRACAPQWKKPPQWRAGPLATAR